MVLTSFSQQYTEYEVKSAYLYNFAKFINWPEDCKKTKKFIIGVYGENKFNDDLHKTLNGRKILDKDWELVVFDNPKKINCHILLVTETDIDKLNDLFKYLKDEPILTIGDNISAFCEKGGIINFTPKGDSKQFEINNDAAKRVHLTISSKLLAIAKIVTDEEDIF
ncbi:MAG: DUF4154 domain-containing protein [Marinilabiliales bacterium]|nr:MAG: DUF4154 domain-containing protein [Marinilabiliales bacterium]